MMRRSTYLVASLALATLSACASTDTSSKANTDARHEALLPLGDISENILEAMVYPYPLTEDAPEFRKRFYLRGEGKNRILALEMLDRNFDGRPDVWRYFSSAGLVVREELDLDFDDLADVIDYYNKLGELEVREILNSGERTKSASESVKARRLFSDASLKANLTVPPTAP